MRSSQFLLVAITLSVFGLGVALLLQPQPTLAQPAATAKKDPNKPEEKNEKISFPENKQTNEQFRGLLEYASVKEDPNYKNLFRVAQLILDAKSDYFYLYPDGANKGERRSVKEETNRIIGTLSKEGLEYYQNFYGPTADNLLKQAKDEGYDRPRLAEIAQRFYHTKAGAEAATLLAAVYLESGNYPEAAYSYRRLLSRPDADKILDARVLFRAAVALRRANDNKPSDEVAAVWEKLEKKFPRDGLQVGRKVYAVEQLKASWSGRCSRCSGRSGRSSWPARGATTPATRRPTPGCRSCNRNRPCRSCTTWACPSRTRPTSGCGRRSTPPTPTRTTS
jgi:TolA-binding protein